MQRHIGSSGNAFRARADEYPILFQASGAHPEEKSFRSPFEMPWRFIDDVPTSTHAAGSLAPRAVVPPDNAYVLSYLLSRLGDLELEIDDLESSASTLDEYLALQRLTAARDNLVAAADEVIFRRAATIERSASAAGGAGPSA
ncbi:MAG TPA: hypothetical protein VFU51_07465 [Gaiellaceae bacterium]|nr:hypothetical protein [Gaiellaceae bacterium]